MLKYILFTAAAILLLILITYFVFKKQIDFFIVKVSGKKRMQKNLYQECKINDYLILNDLYVLVGEDRYKKVDTIIFGNKYLYIVSEVIEPGEIKVVLDDELWRNIYKGKLYYLNNPFKYNRRVIEKLLMAVNGLEAKDFKSIVVVNKNATFNSTNKSANEYIVSEKEAIKLITEIEKNSTDDIIDPYELERYCQAFYDYGLKIEKAKKGKS